MLSFSVFVVLASLLQRYPAHKTTQQRRSAVDLECMILRIDDVIASGNKAPPAMPQGMPGMGY